MSQEKRKSENYTNLGGINTKASQYITGPTEFLNLVNVDFQTPGSLTKRWGSSQYIGPTFGSSFPIQSLFEYERLDGFSQIIFSHTGGLWFGSTTGNHQGFSFGGNNFGATSNLFEIDFALNGLSTAPTKITYDGKPFITINMPRFRIAPRVLGAGQYDYAVLNDWTFFCDGANFLKFHGITPLAYNLPLPNIDNISFTGGGATTAAPYFIESGYQYNFYVNWLNVRGFQSPLMPFAYIDLTMAGDTLASYYGSTLIRGFFGFTMIDGYGITALQIWQYRGNLATNTFDILDTNAQATVKLMHSFNSGGSNFIIGSTAAGQSAIYFGDGWDGGSYAIDGLTGIILESNSAHVLGIAPVAPKFLEVYSNRLFSAGYSSAQSSVRFTDVGEPEGYQLDWNFEIRTNDGDVVTGLKAYNSRLYIFKNLSFHELSGDSPDNFFIREVSDQYGCLSNRASAVFNNVMFFLDRKGVVEFNGANTTIISSKIQSIFDRMNIDAAKQNATMVHDRTRNQLLIGIPVDGSTTNNLTVVYDYLVGAWTTYNGYSPAVYAIIRGRLSNKVPMWGDYGGRIMYTGQSFLSDNGTGFTEVITTRFLADMGNSVQKQFRRLFLDTTVGATSPMLIKFFQDHGSSIVYQATMSQLNFQSRIDYGISARCLSLQLEHSDNANTMKLNGLTIEYRIQRVV